MNVGLLTLLLFGSMLVLVLIGMPIAFAIGGVSVIFAFFFWGYDYLYILASSAYSSFQNLNLVAIPLFVFMGIMLQASGMAEDLFMAIRSWMGRVKGGLVIGTIIVSAIWAAISGEIVASIYVITSLALIPMVKYGYERKLVIGAVISGATMTMLIPPSISAVVFASVTGVSLGRLYLAMFVPGMLIVTLFCAYAAIICRIRPKVAPVLPKSEEPSFKEKLLQSRRALAPLIILFGIIISIYSGIITAMEASTVGAAAALLVVILYKRMNRKLLKDTLLQTLKISSMIAWMLMAIGMFTAVYSGIGASKLAAEIAGSLPGGGWVVVIITQIVILIAGMFLDDMAIIMIFAPIFTSIITALGFDPIWYGAVFMVNIQLAFMSPPYGFALFVMRGAIPKEMGVTMGEIIRSVVPFQLLQLTCLILTTAFPAMVLFLPNLIMHH